MEQIDLDAQKRELRTVAQVLDEQAHASTTLGRLLERAAITIDDLEKLVAEMAGRLESRMTLDHLLPTIRMIALEREKQRVRWGADHDDKHDNGELAWRAAELAIQGTPAKVAYVLPAGYRPDQWGLVEKHEGDRIRQLVIAGALIAAEIDRLSRLQQREPSPVGMQEG